MIKKSQWAIHHPSGWLFERREDGCVRIEVPSSELPDGLNWKPIEVVLTAMEWSRIVAKLEQEKS